MRHKCLYLLFIASFMVLCSSGTTAMAKGTKVTNKDPKALEKEVRQLREKLKVMEMHKPEKAKPLKMTVYAYLPTKKKTAALKKSVPGFAAVSRDHCYLLGKQIYIEGYGVIKVTDLMAEKHKNSIDICVATLKKAKDIGCKQRFVAVL